MATVLKLVRCDLSGTDVDSLDLMGGLGAATGIVLTRDGWVQQIPAPGTDSVTEALTLRVKGSSNDNLAAIIQNLDAKIKQVQDWLADPHVERYLVVLRVKMNNETYERQAFIRGMTGSSVPVMQLPAQLDSDIGDYTLTIERIGAWEDVAPYPSTSARNGINFLGGTAALAETIRGDVRARVLRLSVSPTSGYVMGAFWFGWKTNRFGNAANFVPVWSLKDGYGPDSSDMMPTADATAYSGTRMTVTFTETPGYTVRTYLPAINVTPNYADQRGSYSVLLRAKMSDSSVARVQMLHGFGDSTTIYNPTYNSKKIISGTAWKLYEVGSFNIPSLTVMPPSTLHNAMMALATERLSGSGALHLDCYILIPKDDGSIKVTLPYDVGGTDVVWVNVFQHMNEDITAYATEADIVFYSAMVEPTRWGITPRDDTTRLVFAADSLLYPGNGKTATADITYAYVPRWLTLRGNES
jgi:hypothetical protein